MKKAPFALVIAFIISCILINCGSLGKSNHENYTTRDIEGDWTLIKVEVIEEKQSIERFKKDGGEIVREWSPPVFLNNKGILTPRSDDFYSISNRDLHIKGDSIFWLNYPLQLKQKSAYTIESNLLKIANNPDHRQIVLSANRDTLTMSYLGDYGLYSKETYQKVTFNDSVINILKLYEINLPLFAGKWEVFREGNIGNDGTEYRLNFPYKIPDSVQITKEELIGILLKGETYNLMTDGKKRNYSLKYNHKKVSFFRIGELILSPTNWLPKVYQGDSQIYLRRLSIERQQLSPQECWNEFLQVITSGNIHNTIDLMTDHGYADLTNKIDPRELEITLKRLGQEWQKSEIKWKEISKTHATAQFGTKGKEKHLEFVKVTGLWKIDVLKNGN